MQELEIINLWKQYDEKLEKSISLNQRVIAELQQQKAKNALRPAKQIKRFAVVAGLVYVACLSFLVYHALRFENIFFVSSLGISIVITLIAIVVYIDQLYLINDIDNSESVVHMQQKLADLQTSTLKIVRILLLQLPFYSTWYINFEWIRESPNSFYFIHLPIVFLFALAAVWLYRNIDIKNMDKKWFKLLFSGPEWTTIVKSGQFLKEIEHFEKA